MHPENKVPTPSRRAAMKRLLAGAAGAALISPAIEGLFSSAAPIQMSFFAGREGSRFVGTTGSGQSVTFVLEQVFGGVQKATTPGTYDCEWFALEFFGPTGWESTQDLYHFEDAKIGRFDLMLTPVWSDDNRPRVESVTNRIIA